MAVDFLARLAKRRSRQRVRSLEAERFRQFPHRKIQLSDTQCFVRLQAEPPLRVVQAILNRARSIFDHVGPVHRLQRKAFKLKIGERLRHRGRLRINQLELMAAAYSQLRAGFRADANPVHAVGRVDCAVGFDADGKAARVQRLDQRGIDLQQRLAAGQDRKAIGRRSRPLRGDGVGKFFGRRVAATQRAVRADEIRVAELARRGGAVLFAAAPEIAARESAEYGGAPGLCAFALEGEKDLLDRVAHRTSPWVTALVCRSASPNAMAAAIATLSERRSGSIGITSRASAAVATSSGTPADSRPNSRMSASS